MPIKIMWWKEAGMAKANNPFDDSFRQTPHENPFQDVVDRRFGQEALEFHCELCRTLVANITHRQERIDLLFQGWLIGLA